MSQLPPDPAPDAPPLQLLSVVIPARNEEGCIRATVEHLDLELRLNHDPARNHRRGRRQHGPHARDSGEVAQSIPALRPLTNPGPHGFGRAIIYGLDHMKGDAVSHHDGR